MFKISANAFFKLFRDEAVQNLLLASKALVWHLKGETIYLSTGSKNFLTKENLETNLKMKNSLKNKILFVLALLLGLMFINAGLNKFLNYMPMPEHMPGKMMNAMKAIMEIGWLLPLVGIVEIFGGILVIIPKTRALGALMLFPIMVGIMLTNINQDTSGLPIALVMAAILIWIMVENRAKYLPLIK